MENILFVILIPVVAGTLVAAQSLWRSAVVGGGIFANGLASAFGKMLVSPKMWLGALLYILTTMLYLFLFSKLKFFVVQVSVTGLALIISTIISYYIFHEKVSTLNIIGLMTVLLGIFLVFKK